MKARIKAWQAVIDPATGKIHDEVGLRALDSIFYGPMRELDEVTDEIIEDMKVEFEKLYSGFCYDRLEIHKGD